MKYIFLGDIYAQTGRDMVKEFLPKYIKKYKPDYIFANTENLSNGKGIKIKHLDELQELGINAFSSGNHIYRNKEVFDEFKNSDRQLRPLNFPDKNPGKGHVVLDDKVLLLNVMGNIFMKHSLSCPFISADKAIDQYKDSDLEIILDIHAEASSEKRAIAEYFDGRVSAVVGTHTHVQTNDARILKKGTGFITDIGMCGPSDSVLGVKKQVVINSMITQMGERLEPEEGEGEFHGVFFEIKKGKCIKIETIKDYQN